jgi:hypothetical protein
MLNSRLFVAISFPYLAPACSWMHGAKARPRPPPTAFGPRTPAFAAHSPHRAEGSPVAPPTKLRRLARIDTTASINSISSTPQYSAPSPLRWLQTVSCGVQGETLDVVPDSMLVQRAVFSKHGVVHKIVLTVPLPHDTVVVAHNLVIDLAQLSPV